MSKITVKVVSEDYPESPREAWDNLGTMVCWHGRYNLGDEQPRQDPEEYLADLPEGAIVLPLYLYDHSGITMSTSGFSCAWDSGQVGFIYVTKERIIAEYGDNSEESRNKVTACLQSEVRVYDYFLTGNVWGYVIEESPPECECCGAEKEPEHVDSCFGFYGDDLEYMGMLDHVEPEHRDALREAWDNRF